MHVDAVGDVVRRWPHRRHDDAEVGGVDDAAPHLDAVVLAAEGAEVAIAIDFAEVLAHREVRHPARRQQVLAHDRVVVGDHLAAARELEEPLVPAAGVDGVGAERARVHAVVRRRLVKPHVGVRAEPVPAGLIIAVDDDDGRVRLGDQGVDEGHAHGAGADHQVVGFDRPHRDSLPELPLRWGELA